MSISVNAKELSTFYSGLYAGIDLGGEWGSSHYYTNPECSLSAGGGTFCSAGPSEVNGLAVGSSGKGKLKLTGFDIGAHLGYNWNNHFMVFGGEVDFDWFNLNKSITAQGIFPFLFLGNSYTLTESIHTNWLATIRGRIGIVLKPQFLLYTTAGAAFTDFEFSSSYHDNAIGFGFPGGAGNNSFSKNKIGWTIGAGGEWMILEHCSVKAEYLYIDFSSTDLSVPISNTAAFSQIMQINADLKANIMRIGLNYWF